MNASRSRHASSSRHASAPRISRHLVGLLVTVVAAAACTAGASPSTGVAPTPVGGSPSQSASASASTLASPGSSEPRSPSADPSAPPSESAAPSRDRTPITIAGCPTTSREGRVPSDTLIKVKVDQDFGVDRITFTFGPAGPQPGGAPTGEVKPARPPFYAGASGETVSIAGDRYIQITFRQMTIADDAGNPVFTGNDDLHPNGLAVREVRELEEFEGVVTWVAGVRGPGCVRVSRLTSPDRIVVEVQQP